MVKIKQIRLCGFGGQGIVLAGTILGYAGINDGKWVASSSSYGDANIFHNFSGYLPSVHYK
ncbi:unnamed protein product [marine sediment metagenome]|uniref:Pyruvate/ketoisovalerate oxidoreductase catalytic domain-containing protein n=1 Tax=marine sediment metagenome TaxID=412755 RepID=X1PJW1_9ZZZZ